MTQKIKTVNVVECIRKPAFLQLSDSDQITIHSFCDNDEGNKEAEELYFEIAKKNGYKGDATNVDEFFDDEGDYWALGDYSVSIIHS
jgi:hypothetical protein